MAENEKNTIITASKKPEPPVEPVRSEAEKKKDEKMAASKSEGPDLSADKRMASLVKDLEQAFFTIKFYPVAANAEAKKEALERIRKIFDKEEETIRQLVLFMAHEHLSQAAELRVMHNYEHFKRKMPAADPAQMRINVYRSMFNHNFSIEGLMDFIAFVGTLEGDDAAKLLTYHFTFFASIEGESTRMLRNSIIAALGESKSPYALKTLLDYAKNTDDEMLLGRVAASLGKWNEKIEGLKLSRSEKEKLKSDINHIMMQETGSSHYG